MRNKLSKTQRKTHAKKKHVKNIKIFLKKKKKKKKKKSRKISKFY